jgi:hypothetical protein
MVSFHNICYYFVIFLYLTNNFLNLFRKQYIHTYNVYVFLREVVSKVPDITSPDDNARYYIIYLGVY